jgi:CrcB protein
MLRLEIVGITSKYLIEGPIPIDIIDNFYGSFIIGFYNDKFKKDDNSFHLAISTGFCGCLTTFSSWIVGVIKLASIN